MITTKYECDKCKKSQDTNVGMFILAIGVQECRQNGYNYINIGNNNISLKGLWCKECCDKHGVDKPNEKVLAPITFEDLIEEMIEAALGKREP